MKKTGSLMTDGLLRDNTVLSAGMVISPVIMCGNTVENALALAYAFTVITFFAVMISSFVPQNLPYAVKVIIYALVSSLLYIPVRMLTEEIYSGCAENIGLYFPLLAVNSLIVYQTNVKFFRMKRSRLITSLAFYILGFDAVILLVAVIRELIGFGTVYNYTVTLGRVIESVSQPFGGFIVLGLLCGIYRAVRNSLPEKEEEVG